MAASLGSIGHSGVVLLTKSFSEDEFGRALDSWTWVDLQHKTPVLASLFGDVFFAAADGYWFLDSMEGTLTRVWAGREQLQADLDSEAGQDRYLLGGLAMAAERSGIALGRTQVYDFKVHPMLGGGFSVENITAVEFVVAMDVAGQLLRQLKGPPPGMPVADLPIET